MRQANDHWLIVLAGTHRVGLPLVHVRETMRPLPTVPLRDTIPCVLGIAVIRGESVAVLDLGGLLGRAAAAEHFSRFVTLEVGGHGVAIAVSSVERVVSLEQRALMTLPPLLTHAAGDAVRAISLADQRLLFVLEATKLLPHLGPEGAATLS